MDDRDFSAYEQQDDFVEDVVELDDELTVEAEDIADLDDLDDGASQNLDAETEQDAGGASAGVERDGFAEDIADLDDELDGRHDTARDVAADAQIGADQPAERDALKDDNGYAACVALEQLGFTSPQALITPELTDRDWQVLSVTADRYAEIADLLERQVARMEEHSAADQYRSHFLGALNEIGSEAQLEKWGEMKNLNDPRSLHGTNPGVDVGFTNDSGSISFEADAKASLGDRPLDYYWHRLVAGEAKQDGAELFVPADHALPLKELIDARLSLEDAERWKARVHESTFSSDHYRTILNACASDEKPGYINTAKARDLVSQLRTASAYMHSRIEDV